MHYDTIEDGQNKKSHLIFSNWLDKLNFQFLHFDLAQREKIMEFWNLSLQENFKNWREI